MRLFHWMNCALLLLCFPSNFVAIETLGRDQVSCAAIEVWGDHFNYQIELLRLAALEHYHCGLLCSEVEGFKPALAFPRHQLKHYNEIKPLPISLEWLVSKPLILAFKPRAEVLSSFSFTAQSLPMELEVA